MSETLLLSCSKEAFLIGTIENALNGVEVDIDSIPESYFKVDIKIVGDEFHSSIDGTVARSLWEFEKSLRNATVQMLHGNSNSNCLTFEEKSYTSINFTVSAGCSNLKADLKPLIKSLGRGFEKMGTLGKICVVGMLCGTVLFGGYLFGEHVEKMEEQEINADNSRYKMLKDAYEYSLPFKLAYTESSDRIAKSASNAQYVEINQRHYTREDIERLNSRSSPTQPEFETIGGRYEVFGIERIENNENSYKVKLRKVGTANTLTAILTANKGLFSELNIKTNAASIGAYIENKEKVDVSLLSKSTKTSQTFYILEISPVKEN